MKTVDVANVEHMEWLLSLNYTDSATNTVKTLRWTTGDEEVPITGDGTYLPRSPIHEIRGLGEGGARLENRQWQLTLEDPNRVYKDLFQTKWFGRQARLSLVTWPGPVATLWKVGWIVQRAFPTTLESGKLAIFTLAGVLDRASGTRKRLMNDKAHRLAAGDDTDDSLADAQRKQDLNWGGNWD